MAGAQLVLLRRLAGAHQIAQCLVRRVRNPDRRQVAAAVAARQLLCVAPVSFYAVAGPHRYQRRRDHLAHGTQLGQLPVQHVAAGSRLVADAQLCGRAQLADHPANRLRPVPDRAERAHLPARLGNCDRDRFGMYIESYESDRLLHDRLLSLVALRYRSSRSVA